MQQEAKGNGAKVTGLCQHVRVHIVQPALSHLQTQADCRLLQSCKRSQHESAVARQVRACLKPHTQNMPHALKEVYSRLECMHDVCFYTFTNWSAFHHRSVMQDGGYAFSSVSMQSSICGYTPRLISPAGMSDCRGVCFQEHSPACTRLAQNC